MRKMIFNMIIMKYNDNINQDKNGNSNNNQDNNCDETMTKNYQTVSKLTKLINHNDK